ncbi:MAG TPA: hypothetical protein VK524_19805, partial [Polyangiaceae bacterium]|nr:hypothetical protein [Polyangiaceae bacterium]
MASTPSESPAPRRRGLLYALLACAVVGAALYMVLRTAGRERESAPRCPPGLLAVEARCCGADQSLVSGHCSGVPRSCAGGMYGVAGVHAGCVVNDRRVS